MSKDTPATSGADETARFTDLGLPEPLLAALSAVGYESPSPIQAATIPPLLAGRDVLGQAQTGTGKTAAFALPILARIDLAVARPQALVLAPTRELAIQVAEAFQKYAVRLRGFHVLPIYGGQSYGPQLASLKRGAHVVVGTPGRVIDHLERGSLKLDAVRHVVLDEADEMLRMGFIDDVENILGRVPAPRQVALFSATMPTRIRAIADKYLAEPTQVAIKARTTTAANVRQRYWPVSGLAKLDALTRILEVEPFEAMIVFTRTKQATEELAGRLQARGFRAAAINGDMEQKQRERTIGALREGGLDILVATDVAARGLDVERVTHVLNYDVPYDAESYVHRIGRTGRAGRSGEAILFVTPRERHMLRTIERATRQSIAPMNLPSVAAINDRRIAKFNDRLGEALQQDGIAPFRELIEAYEREHDVPAIEIAAALARRAQGEEPLLLAPNEPPHVPAFAERPHPSRPTRAPRGEDRVHLPRHGEAPPRAPRRERSAEESVREQAPSPKPRQRVEATALRRYRVDVGHAHGVKPGNLVGAIANEGGLDNTQIGRIDIRERFSLIELPADLGPKVLKAIGNAKVAHRPLRIAPADAIESESRPERGQAPPRRQSSAGFEPPKRPKPKR
jgi:ATP-dependent RNA helicase DeaD